MSLEPRYFHLVKPYDHSSLTRNGDRGSKMVTEVFLTRLVITKRTLQPFIDELFEGIFGVTSGRHSGVAANIPVPVKFMFDFFDEMAAAQGIVDPEVTFQWKTNALPLRFWVNVIQNPHFMFDVPKSSVVNGSLAVISQVFMDSCSRDEHKLSKDSPSTKLLFAKDIPKYRKLVERYYAEVAALEYPVPLEQAMTAALDEHSRAHQHEFNVEAALRQLHQFAFRYRHELLESLKSLDYLLASKFAELCNLLDVNL